ncbi:PDC sensor domain-containing protein [Hydrogenobaculum acidophilum]
MPKAENYVSLDIFSSNIPAFDYEDKVDLVYRFFKEKPFYKYIVVLKNQIPIGIVKKDDIAFANRNLNIGELSKPLPKVKNTNINPQRLSDVIEILRLQVSDLFLVNNKNQYIGIINYDTIIHYLTKFPDVSQDKISKMLGKDYYALVIGFQDFKKLREELGYKIDSLFKLINDLLKSISKECCTYIEKQDSEIYSVHKTKITKDLIMQFFDEFYKEYSVLFQHHETPIIYAVVMDLSNIKTYEAFTERINILKVYIKNMKNTIAIFDGLQPLLATYISKKDFPTVQIIKEKIFSSIEDIANVLVKSEKNLWEFMLYDMFKKYPFYDLIYIMNENGIQISNNIINPNVTKTIASGKKGANRAEEVYFKKASEIPYITEVYLSKATDDFCITISKAFKYQNKTYVVAGDIAYSDIGKISLQS